MPVFGSTISVEAEIRTGMVCDWWPARVKVTVNSVLATPREQGVRQVWLVEVRASAPAGSDSNWIVVVAGPNPGIEKLGMLGMLTPEHPATVRPQAAMATIRFIGRVRPLMRPVRVRRATAPGSQTIEFNSNVP